MVGELLDSLAIWPFTERLGWSKAQVEALTNAARAEIGDLSLKLEAGMSHGAAGVVVYDVRKPVRLSSRLG